ncbi:hypothetical protein LXL04_011238 [Taraxacum kok-saghyz]
MERFAPVGMTVSAFVKWEEVFSTNHRGRREVRYYLKRRDGTSDLAVVGKEKKSGSKMKTSPLVSSSYRYRYAIRDKSLFPSSEIFTKLRSRRQVIDWLSSLVTDGSFSQPPKIIEAGDTLKSKSENFQDVHLHKSIIHQTPDLQWVGSFTFKKKRKHYEAYTRSGVKISVDDFVYVLAEEDKRLVAHLEDLYQDSKGNKVAVVRWFHKVDEVFGIDHHHKPHNPYYNINNNHKEIFFSLCAQDLNIECIDGPATVLTPQHYQNFLKLNPLLYPKFDPFVCQNQFDDEGIKPFDLTKVKGYWNQNIHKLVSLLGTNDDDVADIRPKKRLRRLVENENEYAIGSEIEVLSQDSGIRGVWFKGVVIKKHKDKLKVRYQDIKDAGDESLNLEEWILSSKGAVLDEFGIRYNGRKTVRPSSTLKNNDVMVDVGSVVDAWWHDGWWEGIVVQKDSNDKRIHVFLPFEKKRLIFECKDLRYSQEWLGGEWKQMKNRFDLVASITCDDSQTKNDNNNNEVIGDDDEKGQIGKFEVVKSEDLKWNWAMRKKRHGRRRPWERLQVENNLVTVKKRKQIDCKSSLFCHSVASPLIMSR